MAQRMEDSSPPNAQPEPEPEPASLPGERSTRLSGAWTAIVIGLIGLVVILVFILQNPKNVEVSFLPFRVQLPLGVAMLFAVILGAAIVVAVGGARIIELRRVAGRARRKSAAAAARAKPIAPEK